MNIADALCGAICEKRNPVVVGLDPVVSRIPLAYFQEYSLMHPFEAVANGIIDFGKDIIDAVSDYVPAIKPQIAFFEMYGSSGIRAFEKVIEYARKRGLIVIEDGKRNDIGNTAEAYAAGHLGKVELADGHMATSFDVDFLTVSSFLGSESLDPFVRACREFNKGIFILVKTSNASSGEVQDAVVDSESVSLKIARYIKKQAEKYMGDSGYSPIGAVVGATYPKDAAIIRGAMPNSIFLVPGYGIQGGTAADIIPCFNQDGLGAIVNASRSILYDYEKKYTRANCSKREYIDTVVNATSNMRSEIYAALKSKFSKLVY